MKADVRLGLRLARGRESWDRLRGGASVLVHVVGVWIILTTLAIIRTELRQPGYSGDGLPLLALTVLATVGVPVVVLVATTARLSAALRDQRLASLRLLGLSHSRTRLVATVETGAGAIAGSIVGALAFWLTRPLVREVHFAGRDWSSSPFSPWPLAVVMTVLALPLAAVIVVLIPGGRSSSALSTRPVTAVFAKNPSWWRLTPLVAGLLAALASAVGAANSINGGRLGLLVIGGVVCGFGLVLVVPVFTRLLADVMVRVPGRPSVRIAGRRLQAQPAGVSRVVAGLVIALFVVAGGRMVVGAWEATPQYVAAARAVTDGPAAYSVTPGDRSGTDRLATELASRHGVLAAYVDRQIQSGCNGSDSSRCVSGFVGTCQDLKAAVPDAVGCRDDRIAWMDEPADASLKFGPTMVWGAEPGASIEGTATPTPARDDVITSQSDKYGVSNGMQAQVFIPISTPGMKASADRANHDTLIPVATLVDPHVLSEAQLQRVAQSITPDASVFAPFDHGDYDFVAGLRALVWGIAAVVLAIGLLGFAIATIDRSVSRRAEMVSLQLVGTPRSVIRAAQWWEAALPLLVGIVVAVGAGTAVGYSYLTYGSDDTRYAPWHSILGLATVGVGGAMVAAALTVVASAPRIRAELIRRA